MLVWELMLIERSTYHMINPLNQISIPGTHDSGSYNIGQVTNYKIHNAISYSPLCGIRTTFEQTQSLDITNQWEHRIRFTDVRLATDDKHHNLQHLSHGNFP